MTEKETAAGGGMAGFGFGGIIGGLDGLAVGAPVPRSCSALLPIPLYMLLPPPNPAPALPLENPVPWLLENPVPPKPLPELETWVGCC